jgi:hypothetical protein
MVETIGAAQWRYPGSCPAKSKRPAFRMRRITQHYHRRAIRSANSCGVPIGSAPALDFLNFPWIWRRARRVGRRRIQALRQLLEGDEFGAHPARDVRFVWGAELLEDLRQGFGGWGARDVTI